MPTASIKMIRFHCNSHGTKSHIGSEVCSQYRETLCHSVQACSSCHKPNFPQSSHHHGRSNSITKNMQIGQSDKVKPKKARGARRENIKGTEGSGGIWDNREMGRTGLLSSRKLCPLLIRRIRPAYQPMKGTQCPHVHSASSTQKSEARVHKHNVELWSPLRQKSQ